MAMVLCTGTSLKLASLLSVDMEFPDGPSPPIMVPGGLLYVLVVVPVPGVVVVEVVVLVPAALEK